MVLAMMMVGVISTCGVLVVMVGRTCGVVLMVSTFGVVVMAEAVMTQSNKFFTLLFRKSRVMVQLLQLLSRTVHVPFPEQNIGPTYCASMSEPHLLSVGSSVIFIPTQNPGVYMQIEDIDLYHEGNVVTT